MYLDKKTQYSDFIEESLTYSIDNELILQSGLFGEYNKTNKPKLIIKSADELRAIKEIQLSLEQTLYRIQEKAFPLSLPKAP